MARKKTCSSSGCIANLSVSAFRCFSVATLCRCLCLSLYLCFAFRCFRHLCCIQSLCGPSQVKPKSSPARMDAAEEMSKLISMCYSKELRALAETSCENRPERSFFKLQDATKLGNQDVEDHVFFLEQLLLKDDLPKSMATFRDSVILLDAEYEGRLSGAQCQVLLGRWACTVAT